jgi:hypothetical protein
MPMMTGARLAFEAKWIRIWNITPTLPPGRKTPVYFVMTKDDEIQLGFIEWHGAWHQYAFFPDEETLYERQCLRDIATFLDKLLEDRNAVKKTVPASEAP